VTLNSWIHLLRSGTYSNMRLGQCICLFPVRTAISAHSYLRMRQRKTRLDKKKSFQQTPKARQRFVVCYHIIGRTRGWVQTGTKTSRAEVF
jgi:hypothetical protein